MTLDLLAQYTSDDIAASAGLVPGNSIINLFAQLMLTNDYYL